MSVEPGTDTPDTTSESGKAPSTVDSPVSHDLEEDPCSATLGSAAVPVRDSAPTLTAGADARHEAVGGRFTPEPTLASTWDSIHSLGSLSSLREPRVSGGSWQLPGISPTLRSDESADSATSHSHSTAEVVAMAGLSISSVASRTPPLARPKVDHPIVDFLSSPASQPAPLSEGEGVKCAVPVAVSSFSTLVLFTPAFWSTLIDMAPEPLGTRWRESTLRRLLHLTFVRALEQHRVLYDLKAAVPWILFHSNLFTADDDPIFIVLAANSDGERASSGVAPAFIGSDTAALPLKHAALDHIRSMLPAAPTFFALSDPCLAFDAGAALAENLSTWHVANSIERFAAAGLTRPVAADSEMSEAELGHLLRLVQEAIRRAKHLLRHDSTTALPQFYYSKVRGSTGEQVYSGSLQFLLPLYISSKDVPTLALAVIRDPGSRSGGEMQASTILNVDMAFSNARLLQRRMWCWSRVPQLMRSFGLVSRPEGGLMPAVAVNRPRSRTPEQPPHARPPLQPSYAQLPPQHHHAHGYPQPHPHPHAHAHAHAGKGYGQAVDGRAGYGSLGEYQQRGMYAAAAPSPHQVWPGYGQQQQQQGYPPPGVGMYGAPPAAAGYGGRHHGAGMPPQPQTSAGMPVTLPMGGAFGGGYYSGASPAMPPPPPPEPAPAKFAVQCCIDGCKRSGVWVGPKPVPRSGWRCAEHQMVRVRCNRFGCEQEFMAYPNTRNKYYCERHFRAPSKRSSPQQHAHAAPATHAQYHPHQYSGYGGY